MTAVTEAEGKTREDEIREVLRTSGLPMTAADVNMFMGRADSAVPLIRDTLIEMGMPSRKMNGSGNRRGRMPQLFALDEKTLAGPHPDEEQNGAEMARPAKTTAKKTTTKKAPAKRTAAKRAPTRKRTAATTTSAHTARTAAPAASEGTFTVTPYQMQGGEPVLADEQGRLYVAKPLEMPEGMRQRA